VAVDCWVGPMDCDDPVCVNHVNRYPGIVWFDRFASVGAVNDGMFTIPVTRVAATHVLVICAKFPVINGSSIFFVGFGCIPRIVRASSVCGPHSLECGLLEIDVQLIHIEF